jgi:zinc protease
MNLEQLRQKNGLETLYIHSPGATSASVQIWFRAGSALEKKSEMGIAHFLEHMFFKGTKKRPGAKIAHEVESFGGEINAFTSFDYTCYYINTPVNHLDNTVDILMDMVSNPEFLESELIPERQVVFEEYRRSLDNPNQFNFKNMQEGSFTKGYSHQILGTEKTIHNFSREQLISFREKYYNLSNSMLIISGDIKNKEKINSTINSYKIPAGKTSSFPKFSLKEKESINIHSKQVNQTTLTLTVQAPHYTDPKSASEDLAINCLCFGELSPLYKNLVAETNIATGVSGSTMFFNNGGVHFLKLAFPTQNAQKVMDQFEKSLKAVIAKGFTEDEVNRIKNQYIASKIYEKESIESYSFTLGHGFAQSGNIHSEDQFIQDIKNTSLNQINASLLEIFSKSIHITVQKPDAEELKGLKTKLDNFQKSLKKISKAKMKTVKREKIETSKFDEEVKVTQIKSGIKLIYRKNTMTPTFVFHSYLKGGLAHESEQNNGSYYFLSRLMTYGYGKLSFEKIKSDLENKSAYLNGFSGKNAYGLTLHGLSENFNDLMDHYFGTLLDPNIPNSYLSNEKELIKRTLHNHKEDPVKQCFKNLNEVVFNKHPYAMSIIGTQKSIKSITRKKLSDLHFSRLEKSEIIFTYCGDLEYEFVLDFLKKKIENLKPRKLEKVKKSSFKPLINQKIDIDFDREQSHIFIGKPAYSIHQKDDLYLKMITTYLSGQSSDLFVEVRDKQGLCYSVQPIHHTALEAGYWGIYIGAGKEKVEKAKEAILKIINKLRDKGLSKSEFNRIKKMLDGQNQLNIQTNDDYANFYSIPLLHGLGIDFQHNTFEKIRSVDHKDFNKFLNKFFTTKWSEITVGPKS